MRCFCTIWLWCILSLISSGDTRPNILYIIADDQAWTDFGFMGNDRVFTPNLDELAEQSVRFVNGYGPSSVCRPSLATLLTGRYPHEHGIHFNHGPPGNAAYNRMTSRHEYEQVRRREFQLIQNVETLPRLLHRKAGYRCLQTGKFWEGHWRNGGFTSGMTTFEPPPLDQEFGGVRTLVNGERVAHGNGDAGLLIGRRTLEPIYDFVKDCEANETPWFVWYAPYLPHQPHDAPEKFYRRAAQMPGVKAHELPYFAAIAQFDDSVGQLMDYLASHDLLRQTIVVFVSDNGWRPSRRTQPGRRTEYAHTSHSKRSPFDDGLRTPILIRWETQVTPATKQELVSTIDLMPTLLSAAKIPWPAGLPGQDLLDATRVGKSSERMVFGEIYPGDASRLGHPQGDIAYRWVRHKELKLIVPHSSPESSKAWGDYVKQISLFDVESDPDESHNLAQEKDYQSRLFELRRMLDSWWTP